MTLMTDFIAGRTPPELYETYLSPGLFEPWADDLLTRTPPNGSCLDLACGTGVVSRKLARHESVHRISAIDVAGPMISHASKLTKEAGLNERIDFQIASALTLPFDDDEFDTAYCQQGLQFFPDRLKALREIGRVLRPKGEFAMAVWTAASDGNPVFGMFGEDLVPLGPFSFGNKDKLARIAEESGLRVNSLERRTANVTLPDIASFVLFDLLFIGRPGEDGALQPIIAADDPSGDKPIRELIEEMQDKLQDFVQNNGTLCAPMTAHILTAST